MSYTVISLFSGAGGCSLGFEQAGYNILFAADFDQSTSKTYSENFKNTYFEKKDVRDINFSAILKKINIAKGELDILIGGPPCQGFSTAGSRFWDDPRNDLLKVYVKALKMIRPKWFLMENVEGLLTAKNGEYLHEATKAFISLGYKVRIEKVYTQEYGIPQRRKRVLIVGNRFGIDFKFPEPTIELNGKIFRQSGVTLRRAIGAFPNATDDPEDKIAYKLESSDQFENYLRGRAHFIKDHYYATQSPLQLDRIRALKPGQTMKDLPERLQHASFRKRANRRVMDGTPTEKRGGSPSGIKRLIFDEPCLTITGAATREFIHPVYNRPLTIRECARVQTFPDNFEFSGNASEKIQQIGNAIPPLMARIFAEHIRVEYGFDGLDNKHGKLVTIQLFSRSKSSVEIIF